MGGLRTTLVVAACAALLGCAKDFDALFADGPDAAAEGGVEAGADGGGLDASCTPTACSPGSETDDGVAKYSCTGCQCACPKYTCPSGRCDATCRTGTSCNI